MSWNEVFQIITGATASTSMAGFIIWKLSSCLGKIWAKKYLESIKKEYQKELETYKTQLDIIKETALRYSGKQFELYNKLWRSLLELKSSADMLWEVANEQNLRKFSQQLKKTIDEVEKSYLFIEDNHYGELSKLLDEFKNYEIGKKKLIQLYVEASSEQELWVNNYEIQQLIDQNKEKKQMYEQLVNEIGHDLKMQLKGKNSLM